MTFFITLGVIVLFILLNAIRILKEYERGVIFRLGRLVGQKGPGLILLIPLVDRMVKIGLRTIVLDVPITWRKRTRIQDRKVGVER